MDNRLKFVLGTQKEIKPNYYICLLKGKNKYIEKDFLLEDCFKNKYTIIDFVNYGDINYTGIIVKGRTIPVGDYFIILDK